MNSLQILQRVNNNQHFANFKKEIFCYTCSTTAECLFVIVKMTVIFATTKSKLVYKMTLWYHLSVKQSDWKWNLSIEGFNFHNPRLITIATAIGATPLVTLWFSWCVGLWQKFIRHCTILNLQTCSKIVQWNGVFSAFYCW